FEPAFYKAHGVRAEFVGHPLADEIPQAWDKAESRQHLNLPAGPLLAVLPGSRSTETRRLAPIFAATLEWLQAQRPDLRYVVPLAPGRGGEIARAVLSEAVLDPAPVFVEGQSRHAMGAADAVLAASGTAVLEAALIKRPCVVAYRFAAFTALVFRTFKLIKLDYYSLPNLLTQQELFPELFQEQATPAMLGPAVLKQLQAAGDDRDWYDTCVQLHNELAQNASARAAELVLKLVQRKQSLARS
ncbi:MAG: lipid-A-disaccharide synthase, partial [Gammaproteobacteria bacterium]